MPSWRTLDKNSNFRQVVWALRLLCLVVVLSWYVAGDTGPCLQSDAVNVRVATVFSKSVVRARLLAVYKDHKNDTGVTEVQFHVSRVIKGLRSGSAQLTVFTTHVLDTDLQCIRINMSCLVFVNISLSMPSDTGVRNAASGQLSRLTRWSKKSLRYVRRHICRSQYCSK